MKGKVVILSILLFILLTLILYQWDPFQRQKNLIQSESKIDSLNGLTFVITKINGNEYYGQSIDGKTKIYFNSNKVKYPIEEKIGVNDKILAYVESENHVDGIVKIEKVK